MGNPYGARPINVRRQLCPNPPPNPPGAQGGNGVDQGLAAQLHAQGIETIEQLAKGFTESSLAQFQRPWGKGRKKIGGAAGAILQSAHALLTNSETVLAEPAIPKHDNFVMFDLEGLPPQLDELGKIYLWGMQVFGKSAGDFQPAVAGFGEQGDKQGWDDFLHRADAIFQQCGDIPFVRWSPYERTRIREYIQRHGDPAGVADRVLSNLLDLLPVARDAVVLPLYSYSLKEIEKYVGHADDAALGKLRVNCCSTGATWYRLGS